MTVALARFPRRMSLISSLTFTEIPMNQWTQLRVMKFAYIAQACSLARFGQPLFDEDVEAWKLGPVIPSVSKELRPYGKEHIKRAVGSYSRDVFSPDQIKLLMDVTVKYGVYTTRHQKERVTYTAIS